MWGGGFDPEHSLLNLFRSACKMGHDSTQTRRTDAVGRRCGRRCPRVVGTLDGGGGSFIGGRGTCRTCLQSAKRATRAQRDARPFADASRDGVAAAAVEACTELEF